MKDIYQIFDENFKSLIEMTERMELLNCRNTSLDLIRVASLADFKDGVFIIESLESIYTQVGPLLDQYDVPESDRKQIKDQLYQSIVLLSQNYKGNDKAKLYEILRDLRSFATNFQFKCWNYWNTKKGKELRRIGMEGEF